MKSRRQRRIENALIVSFGGLAVVAIIGALQAWPGFPPITGPVRVAILVFWILSIISTVVFWVLLIREERNKRK